MTLPTEYRALREGAGIVDRSARGRLTLNGADRRTYLQGLLSNDIEALAAGAGCYAAYLTAQGRMIADMRVFETGRSLLVDLDGSRAAAVAARWTQFVFSEDVQISNDSDSTAEIGVYGPLAAHVVSNAVAALAALQPGDIEEILPTLPLYGNRSWDVSGASLAVLSSDDIGVRGFDLIIPSSAKASVLAVLQQSGAVLVGAAVVEACRVEGGRPLFGVDMTEDTIPLEAGIEDRAISLTKGCYVGQEVIIRVLHRGHGRVARRLVGMIFEPGAPVPSPGAKIDGADREIGWITSAVASPALGRPVALGYVHRDYVQPGTALTVGTHAGTVAGLPFVPIDSAPAKVTVD
jgi:tRNA-modifying protein YgfZ